MGDCFPLTEGGVLLAVGFAEIQKYSCPPLLCRNLWP